VSCPASVSLQLPGRWSDHKLRGSFGASNNICLHMGMRASFRGAAAFWHSKLDHRKAACLVTSASEKGTKGDTSISCTQRTVLVTGLHAIHQRFSRLSGSIAMPCKDRVAGAVPCGTFYNRNEPAWLTSTAKGLAAFCSKKHALFS